MAEVYAFLADGSEEVECLAVADVLVRAGIKVTLVSISNNKEVTGSHGFTIVADTTIGEIDFEQADLLFLPGHARKAPFECRPLCDVKANEGPPSGRHLRGAKCPGRVRHSQRKDGNLPSRF
ncbi:MAG: DJ-1/PfpI family protein [[Clostridium] symbiosum]